MALSDTGTASPRCPRGRAHRSRSHPAPGWHCRARGRGGSRGTEWLCFARGSARGSARGWGCHGPAPGAVQSSGQQEAPELQVTAAGCCPQGEGPPAPGMCHSIVTSGEAEPLSNLLQCKGGGTGKALSGAAPPLLLLLLSLLLLLL